MGQPGECRPGRDPAQPLSCAHQALVKGRHGPAAMKDPAQSTQLVYPVPLLL